MLLGQCMVSSVVEPRHIYAAPTPDKNFDAVPVAPASTIYQDTLYKQTIVNMRVCLLFSSRFFIFQIVLKVNRKHFFYILPMLNIKFRAGASKMLRLLAALAPVPPH
jgi:hypothetical protein